MNSYDKYAEMTEDQQWRYVEGLDVNNELDNLNHEIESKAQEINEEQLIFADGTEGIEAAAKEMFSKSQERKNTPVFSGVLKYFPNALKEVAKCSKAGNDQHHPEKPLHWDMDKSKDEYDALTRHLIDHTVNPLDEDGILHLTKVAWRALAGLERHLTNKL
jgi:hypothetical protein